MEELTLIEAIIENKTLLYVIIGIVIWAIILKLTPMSKDDIKKHESLYGNTKSPEHPQYPYVPPPFNYFGGNT